MKKKLSVGLGLGALLLATNMTWAQSQAREAGYLYLSPKPGASYLSAQTRYVLVRLVDVPPTAVTNLTSGFIRVVGAASGVHAGTTSVATDGRTVRLEMSKDFSGTELVTVTLDPQLEAGASGLLNPYQYQFRVMAPMPGSLPSKPAVVADSVLEAGPADGLEAEEPVHAAATAVGTNRPAIMPNGVSVPTGWPDVVISVKKNPSPGDLFLENRYQVSPQFSMILDTNGWPVWYVLDRRWDLKIQRNGMITCGSFGKTQSQYVWSEYDQNFNHTRDFGTTNGYAPDNHELEVLSDGGYLILGYRVHTVDLRPYISGGSTSARVRETAVQGFTAAGELILQCRAWDYFNIADVAENVTDFTHMNALDIDEDGNLLVSSRMLSEVTKINRDTGDLMWRLGGTNSSFTFPNDPLGGLSFQHDINALGNGHYTIFDNGNYHDPQVSRAVEYQLDLTNMTATMVWEFRDTPDNYTWWMGNAQRLPTGNTLINFVRSFYPAVIEVDPNGVKQFELTFVPNSDQYRSFRFPWNGTVAVPYLIAEPQADNVTLIFNKFGDHAVDHYRIYGGTSSGPTQLVATSTSTLLHLTNLVNGVRNYWRVTAVSTNGTESGYSNEASLPVNITLPGENMVVNGDFMSGTNGWTWAVTGTASAQWVITNQSSHFAIAAGGAYLDSIQLRQAGMRLTQGKEYTLEFDAWSAAPRTFEAKVEQDAEPGINYSGIQPFTIIPVPNHYTFTFTMEAASDYDARVVFNAGVLPHDVYLDNVSLRERVYAPGDFDYDGCVGFPDLKILAGEWQNQQGELRADLNGDGRVDFKDYVKLTQGWSSGGSCP